VKISYQVGLAFDEADDVEARTGYEELANLSDYTAEKHELFAYLLMMAVRLEWRMADRSREYELDRQRREERRRERAEKKAAEST
jgi:hypothetical protein